MHRPKPGFTLLFLAIALLLPLAAGTIGARSGWQEKVDNWVLDAAASSGEVSYLVILRQQADLDVVAGILDKEERGRAAYDELTRVALLTQAPLIAELEEAGVPYRPYWISNMIWVRSDEHVLERMARRADVARLHANPWTKLELPVVPDVDRLAARDEVEWNIARIGAPAVWANGVTGEGAVIGGQDTGYDWRHPALQSQYRGWDGAVADHDYNWHDAIHEDSPDRPPGNACGYDVAEPCDDRGHGTHTLGTMVGGDGPQGAIGVAPGAQWIGCRNMEEGFGTPATYAECYEWFVAPYPYGGDPFTDGDPSRAPHVINNSWGCPAYEGCTDPDILRQVVENVRAAGIVTVNSASNEGPLCATVEQPAAIYDASFTVGATTVNQQHNSDVIASFSSRGPAAQIEGALVKPDISAPGASVLSSLPGDRYGTLSGTSMAAPHVAGLVALLVDAQPRLAGDVDRLEELIEQTAVPLFSEEGCGGDTEASRPNNTYGWGRIDALAAYEAAVGLVRNKTVYNPLWLAP